MQQPRRATLDSGLAAHLLPPPSGSSSDRRVPPRVLEESYREGWPLSPYPDGDYYIFLADDLRFGTFGHPWEYSLCVFGAELLDAISEDVHQVLQRVLRRDGLPTV
ncbi:DUF2716 domain-containing protein [Streptomyces sp. NPDC056352]|uniref:DUF2716 domain-containing protein n=1 Tax=Streptomyces sp. NPDC056352 TaxID=3345791 RepID=UPI0035DBC592